MMKDFKDHAFHYLILFLILSFGFFGFEYFSYNPVLKSTVVLIVAALYVTWGVVHHSLEKSLNLKIVVEYTSIAALAATVLLIII